MKVLLNETLRNMKITHHDDQLAVMEYYFRNPHIVSLDTSSKIFLCAYKFLPHEIAFNYTTGDLMIRQQHSTVGLIHFNSGMVNDLSNK